MTDLNRLLSRLHQTVLRADADRERRLRTSEYERTKVNVNIDYARTLLTQTEHDALAVKVHARRQELQADLNRKRELLEQLADRMRDLEETAARADGGDEGDDTSDGEDVLADIIPTPSESMDSRSAGNAPEGDPGGGEREEEGRPPQPPADPPVPSPPEAHEEAAPGEEPPAEPRPAQAETQTSQTLRSRGRQAAAAPPEGSGQAEAGAAGLSTGASRALLFGGGSRPAGADPAVSTAEAVLDHHKAEQDLLSESILRLAGELKLSSLAFGEALEEDTEVLARAGDGLDRSERGLEAAARRMGALVQMTEGKGWWGRVMLYAWIYGTMVFLVLLVFVLPKLRF